MSLLAKVKGGVNKADITVHSILPGQYRQQDFWFFSSDGNDYKITFDGHNSSLKAYMKCAPLAAIINKKTQAYLNGKTWIVNKKGKAREKEAQGEYANKVRALMAKPNPFQSQRDFEAQLYTYIQISGWCIVLFPSKPVGYGYADSKRMWVLPPCMIDIEETKKNWFAAEGNSDLIKKIVINFGNEKAEIPLDACYIFKDTTVSFGNPLFPESRTVPLEYPINNTIGAYESRGKLIDYRGALGIISPDSKDSLGGGIPMKDDDKLDLQKDFLQYGLKRSQFQYIISTAAVKWSQMGTPTKDLMLFEEIEDNIMRICDGYNFPYPLMSSNRTNSLGGNNIYEAKKLLYQDATIPEAESLAEQWSKVWEFDKSDLMLIKDYSHVPALQDDEQKKSAARKTRNEAYQIEFFMNMVTLNQWRIANGEDPVNDDIGERYYYELVAKGIKFGSGSAPKMETSANQQQENQNQETPNQQQ